MPYLCFFVHYPLLKTNCYKRYVTKYKKLEEAKIRLAEEQDVVHLIELSRVSRLLKEVQFQPHQTDLLKLSHKFVITDEDIKQVKERTFEKEEKD